MVMKIHKSKVGQTMQLQKEKDTKRQIMFVKLSPPNNTRCKVNVKSTLQYSSTEVICL